MKVHSLYIRLRSLLAIALIGIAAASCSDEEIASWNENIQAGLPTTVKLRFDVSVPEEKVSSRADESSDDAVFDLYVFIFDSNGDLVNKQLFRNLHGDTPPEGTQQPDPSGSENYVTMDARTGRSYIYGIANVDGSVNEYSTNIEEELDKIETRNELLSFSATLRESVYRLGNSYLMTGSAVDNEEDGTYTIIEDTDIRTIKLRRLDSQITFNLSAGEGCTFRPTSYQICNIPKKAYLVEREATQNAGTACTWDGTADEDIDDYFDSEETTGNIATDMGFTFWMVENRLNGKQDITNQGNEKVTYGLREKENKEPIEGATDKPTVTNNGYVYAPDNGTYVIIKGEFAGESTVDGNSGPVEADVTYVIHLGYVDGEDYTAKANDFFSNRNTKYTYNVTVNGVNDIIVEVIADDAETEPAPGAEGDVIFTEGTTRYRLDSHYETVLLRFSRTELQNGEDKANFFSYRVETPFASYLWTGDNDITYYDNKDGIVDEAWIKFVRNETTTYGQTYSEDFQPYNNEDLNYLTLPEFINELKAIANGEHEEYYDKNDEVVYTCHIDEFYYDNAPEGVNVGNTNLWKRFVNTDPREVQILNDIELSADGESSITRSTYVLTQRSIQTFFNTDLEEKYSAYGVETINETGPLRSWYYYPDQIGNRGYVRTAVDDRVDGKGNFWGMIEELSNYLRWNTYVDETINGYTSVGRNGTMPEVNAMKGNDYNNDYNYQRAYLACMQRNRDLNGDSYISEDEIKWYLPAIDQYVGMFIGEGGLTDEDARLFTETSYVYKHYVSSTLGTRNDSYYPIIYWAEESVSESVGVEWNMAEYEDGTYTDRDRGDSDTNADRYINHYRCMRNLGNENSDGELKNYYEYDSDSKSITVPYLSKDAVRDVYTFGELDNHYNDDEESKVGTNGFNYYTNSLVYDGQGTNYYDVGHVMRNNYTRCRYINGYAYGTWRAPNLRELFLMSTNDVLTNNETARTEFKFSNSHLPNSNSMQRIGWQYDSGIITMGGGLTTNGNAIRCVRDNAN